MFKQASEYRASEADRAFEVTDNTTEFESHDGPPEHAIEHILNKRNFDKESFDKLTLHQKSLKILEDEGYNSINEAEKALFGFEKEVEQAVGSFWKRIKHKLSSQAEEVKKITDLEAKVQRLSGMVKIANTTAAREGAVNIVKSQLPESDNVIRVPESTWKRSGNNSEVPNEALVEAEAELAQLEKEGAQIFSDVTKGIREVAIGKAKASENNKKYSTKNRKEHNDKIKKLQEQIDLLKAA